MGSISIHEQCSLNIVDEYHQSTNISTNICLQIAVCTRTHSPDDHTRCQSDNRLIGFENFQRDISWIRSCHRVRNLNQWIHSKFMNYDSEFWSCPFSRDHWSDGILPLDDLEALWSLKFRQAITSLKNRLRSSFWFLSIYFQFLSKSLSDRLRF